MLARVTPDQVAAHIARYQLRQGDLGQSVALCALWKDLDKLALTGDELHRFALVGNLYTPRGISILLRTLWLLPTIRHLFIWGPDLTNTGDALLRLWQHGVESDDSHATYIAGTRIRLDDALPQEAIHALRTGVILLDRRQERRLATLLAEAVALPPLPPHAPPRAFPDPVLTAPQVFPSLQIGFQVQAPRVADAWPQILQLVLRFGNIKPTEYGIEQKEVLGLTTVIHSEDPNVPYLAPFFSFTRDELDAYLPQVLEAILPEGLSYTYGSRLRVHFGKDQLATMIARLKAHWYTRRAVAVLWDPREDAETAHPPCINQLMASVVDGRLHMTYVVRSQDMFAAWPQNTFAILKLQQQIAQAVGLQPGNLSSFSFSAHIYADDWGRAQAVVAGQWERMVRGLELDPQGNFVIAVHDGAIEVELLSPAGDQVLWRARDTRADRLSREIAALRLASLPSHYLYLGRELQRAEEALRRGVPYAQERG